MMTRTLVSFVLLGAVAHGAILHAPSAGAADAAATGERAAQPAAGSAAAGDAASTPAAAGPGYRVGPEDILEISVWKEEGLKKEVLVRPDGGISFPLVGEILAVGKTAEEIQVEVTERLKKIINDPVVSVSVLKVAGNKIYVIGRVARPGEFVAGRYIDVLQALSMAGGLTPYAAENDIKVLRKRNGKDEVFRFEYSDIRKGRNLEQNILLQGGDVVVVP
jgi:polysaccharide export outer membrane protein